MVWPAIIAAGASLAGGLIGGSQSKSAAKTDWERQKEMAQKGIQWKVADAKKAGVHPIYALGGSSPSYSPSARIGGSALGSGIASAGQDLSRAITSASTASERQEAQQHLRTMRRLDIAEANARIDALNSQTARLNSPTQVPPPMPTGRQSTTGTPMESITPQPMSAERYIVQPAKVPTTIPGSPNQQAGAQPDITWIRTGKHSWRPVPNKEAYEDADITNPSVWPWYGQHYVGSNFGQGSPPPDNRLPPKALGWRWNSLKFHYEPFYKWQWKFVDKWLDYYPRRK